MECLDLDSSLMAVSEMGQVDFLQDMQQNMSKFQSLIEKLGSRIEQLENTTSTHTKSCICMNKAIQQQMSTSTSSPSAADSSMTSDLDPAAKHPEIARIDSTINTLDSKFQVLRNDLVELANTVKTLKGQASSRSQADKNKNSANAAVSSSSAGPSAAPASTSTSPTMTSSKLFNVLSQRNPQIGSNNANVPRSRPPPLLIRAPVQPATSLSKKLEQSQQQQPKPKVEAIPTLTNPTPNFDNESDDDAENMSDEYEGEEESGGPNADEEHDDTFMQIEPEVILYDDDDDEGDAGGGGPNFGQDAVDVDPDEDLGEQDDYDDGMNYELGFGTGEDEGPMVDIEFRDKLGNIIRCRAYEQTGKIRCPICDVQCMSRRNIIRHYNNKHADPKYYECSVCLAILNRKDSLTVHLRNQHNLIEQDGRFVLAPPTTADSAAQPTTSFTSNTTSTSATTGGASTSTPTSKPSGIQYSCNSCGKSFSRPDALTSHNCILPKPSSSSSNGLLSTSTTAAITGTSPPKPKPKSEPQSLLNPAIAKKCPLCPKTFAVRSYLVRHLKAHTQNNQCVACGKTYSRRDKLRAHQRKHHGGVLDDNYFDQNLDMNRASYDDGDGDQHQGEGEDLGFGLGLGDGDLDFDADAEAEAGLGLPTTPMWAFS